MRSPWRKGIGLFSAVFSKKGFPFELGGRGLPARARRDLEAARANFILIEGQELRLDADYELPGVPASEAAEQIQRAEKFLRLAGEFFYPALPEPEEPLGT